MRKLRVVAAILLALPLLVFGSNYFLRVFALPPGDASPGTQVLDAMRAGGLMSAIAFSHVVVGLLLLIRKTRFLGGLLQLPMSTGIVAFHFTMLPAGLALGVVVLVLNVCVLADTDLLDSLLE